MNTESQRDALDFWDDLIFRIKHQNRFFVENFYFNTLKDVLVKQESIIRKSTLLYRARIGADDEVYEKPINISKMGKVPYLLANNGRANPKGISYLYTASNTHTAIAEVKPFKLSYISVANIKVRESLRIIDLSKRKGKLESAFKDYLIFLISEALSHPIMPDEQLEYVPSQYISELIKELMYDGFKFKSSLGNGYNIVLFNENKIDYLNVKLYRISAIKYSYLEYGL